MRPASCGFVPPLPSSSHQIKFEQHEMFLFLNYYWLFHGCQVQSPDFLVVPESAVWPEASSKGANKQKRGRGRIRERGEQEWEAGS